MVVLLLETKLDGQSGFTIASSVVMSIALRLP
jgi:hypothetical protein